MVSLLNTFPPDVYLKILLQIQPCKSTDYTHVCPVISPLHPVQIHASFQSDPFLKNQIFLGIRSYYASKIAVNTIVKNTASKTVLQFASNVFAWSLIMR